MKQDMKNPLVGVPGGISQIYSSTGGTTLSLPQFTAEMAAKRAQGTLLLLVLNPETGRYRRRIYLSLSAAEKAVQRAEARGHIAHIVLGRFSVVEVVTDER